MSTVPLHCHREPAVLEGRDHLGPLPDLLSCLFTSPDIICYNIVKLCSDNNLLDLIIKLLPFNNYGQDVNTLPVVLFY